MQKGYNWNQKGRSPEKREVLSVSSFMMSEESLAKIAAFIAWNVNDYQPDIWISTDDKNILKNACKEEGERGRERDDKIRYLETFCKENLYRALERMNAEALHQRYGDALEENISKELPTFPWYSEITEIEVYKLIQCYLYQCSEGNVPASRLYKTIENIGNIVAHSIISKMPEYEAVAWG